MEKHEEKNQNEKKSHDMNLLLRVIVAKIKNKNGVPSFPLILKKKKDK